MSKEREREREGKQREEGEEERETESRSLGGKEVRWIKIKSQQLISF